MSASVGHKKYRFIDLFAGIGGLRMPFEELGGACVFSSEIDGRACDMYEANFGERPEGDITKIPAERIPDHEVLLAGFPCQPFSIIGDRNGFDDTRGTLFFEIERILSSKRPAAFLLENVKQLVTHDRGRTFSVILRKLEGLGYVVTWKILNALEFGLPQKRERVFIVGFQDECGFRFPSRGGPAKTLADILEPDDQVDKKHFASRRVAQARRTRVRGKSVVYPSIWHENKSGNVGVHEYSCALRAGASYNYLLVNGVRRPTPRECLRLQGFPDSFNIVVSDAEVRKQTGNSVSVPVVRAIATAMVEAMLGKGIGLSEQRQLPLAAALDLAESP